MHVSLCYIATVTTHEWYMAKRQQRQDITAIIFDKRGRVLSIGQNSYVKTHPIQMMHAKRVNEQDKIFLHAEVAAIVKCKNLKDAHSMFIARWYKNGEPANATPCKVCMSAISSTNIKIINHT